MPRQQRPTAKRIWDRLKEWGYTVVKGVVRELRCRRQEVFVPWAHHPVVVQAGYREVTRFAQGEEVARHRRVWERERVRFEPLHYLALLERKPGALDYARPLAGWILPECFVVLRRRLEARSEGSGTREYIRVLRLLEYHPVSRLRSAVESGLRVRAITRDAIAQCLFPPADAWQTTFELAGHPHLRHVRVAVPDLGEYQVLTGEVPDEQRPLDPAAGASSEGPEAADDPAGLHQRGSGR